MELTSIQASLLLQRFQGIGDITAQKLVDHCGSDQAVFKESKINLLKIKGIGTFHLQGFHKFERCFSTVLEEEKFLKKEKITPILYNSCDYPKTLVFLPMLLWFYFKKERFHGKTNIL
tara:strand:- start:670 stop:1023 length:354 start_codon:yes stop_codon:yes gene_type:complete